MLSLRQIFVDIVILIVVVVTAFYVYQNYKDTIVNFLFGEQPATMYVKSVPISVTIADERAEHIQGLSGVNSLREFEGKLFIYDKEGFYNMWMKDMLIALDIIWIDNDLEVVHIEENVTPDTYPKTFSSPVPARFVLEVNAFFARNNSLQVGDKVLLPSTAIPRDLIEILQ